MSFQSKTYIRAVKKTYTTYEVWTSTAGKRGYIEQDGTLLFDMPSKPEIVILEDFREPTEIERAFIASQRNTGRSLGSVEHSWEPDPKKPS